MYDRVGGEPFFVELVDRFYEGVAGDPTLRPLYPADLTDAKAHLAAFLVQYWGGPAAYSAARGHPRLRMRHAPFLIGLPERGRVAPPYVRCRPPELGDRGRSERAVGLLRDGGTVAHQRDLRRGPGAILARWPPNSVTPPQARRVELRRGVVE